MLEPLTHYQAGYRRGVNVDDPKRRVYHPVLSGSNTITWGEPAEITEAKADRACPYCGAIKGEGKILKNGRVIPGGFELIFDLTDTFGARCLCGNCGFSF
ncbi:MAG: sialidase family protein [Planctomycetota bacterium]